MRLLQSLATHESLNWPTVWTNASLDALHILRVLRDRQDQQRQYLLREGQPTRRPSDLTRLLEDAQVAIDLFLGYPTPCLRHTTSHKTVRHSLIHLCTHQEFWEQELLFYQLLK